MPGRSTRSLPAGLSAADMARFEANIDKSGPCWIWTGYRLPRGYGLFHVGGSRILAHRLSYAVFVGPVPGGLHVLHNCPGGDNPRCVNPRHLRPGTNAENAADTAAKGRSTRGEKNPQAKLTDAQIPQVFARRAAGDGRRAIARALGVSASTVGMVLAGQCWGHVGAGKGDPLARGKRCASAKLTEAQVVEILAASAAGEAGHRLATRFGVSKASISRILSGKQQPGLAAPTREGRPRGERVHGAKLTEMQVAEAFARSAAGEMGKDIAARFGVSRPTISQILSGKRWTHLTHKPIPRNAANRNLFLAAAYQQANGVDPSVLLMAPPRGLTAAQHAAAVATLGASLRTSTGDMIADDLAEHRRHT